MKDKAKINKETFLKPFKNMLFENGENGLNYISKECIVQLIHDGTITEVHHGNNIIYKVNFIDDIDIELMEMIPDFYKFIEGGKVGEFLRNYLWRYDGKNVYTYGAVDGKKVTLERVILNYVEYGYFKPVHLDDEAHHMWFRFCALNGMLKSLPKTEHRNGHREIGFYDRGQSLRIDTVSDFRYVLSEVVRIKKLLKNKKFSIEC